MGRIGTAVLLLLAALLVFGALAPNAAPLALASPESGSMEPTAPQHSLVVLVDKNPSVGDIALYNTPARETAVLHRLVGESEGESEFITRGDANPRTDQELGEPAVRADQIHGVVPEIAGTPLVIPYAGQVFANPVVIIGIWNLLILSVLYSTGLGNVIRGSVVDHHTHLYLIGLGLVVMVLVPLTILATPFLVETQLVTTTTADPESSQMALPGDQTEHTISINSPLLAVLQTGADVTGDIQVQGVESSLGSMTADITVTNPPSDTPAVHQGEVTVYTYVPVLPQATQQALLNIHPVVPAAVNGILVGGPMVVLGLAMDGKRLIRATRSTIFRKRRKKTTPKGFERNE